MFDAYLAWLTTRGWWILVAALAIDVISLLALWLISRRT